MTIKELINSANSRVVNLQQAEFTPEAELAALELQLAMAKLLYEQTMCTHPLDREGNELECFS